MRKLRMTALPIAAAAVASVSVALALGASPPTVSSAPATNVTGKRRHA